MFQNMGYRNKMATIGNSIDLEATCSSEKAEGVDGVLYKERLYSDFRSYNRKVRKSKTIGKKKLISIKDDARRRAAKEFLLGIELDSDNMVTIAPVMLFRGDLEEELTPNSTSPILEGTPKMARTISFKSSREDLAHVSAKSPRHSYTISKSPTHKVPLQASLSVDYHLPEPAQLAFKEERTHPGRYDAFSHSEQRLVPGQRYMLVSGGDFPISMFTIIPYKRSGGNLRMKQQSFSLGLDLDEIDLGEGKEVSLEHLLSPVWSLADRRDLLLQLSFSEAHKDAWLKNVHTFWRNNHSIDNVLINYHPDLVDNEKVFNGRKVTTIQQTSYMASLIEYSTPEDEKKDLNKRFSDVYPHILIKLSKIRKLKRDMKQVVSEAQIDMCVLCYAFVYFEKLVLVGKVNRINCKPIAGACLLLAAKFLHLQRTDIKKLIHEVSSVLKVPSKDVILIEFPVVVALKFSLIVPDKQYSRHLERLQPVII